MPSMTVVKKVPDQVMNQGAVLKSLDLKEFIQIKDSAILPHFQAGLADGRPLPAGLICTTEGIITGIAGKDTQGNYEVVVNIEDIEGEKIQLTFHLMIKPAPVMQPQGLLQSLKGDVWEALGKGLPLPEVIDLKEFLNRPVSPLDIYYLLERFACLTIWDAYNLDAPGKLQRLSLKGTSPHYHIYDRGSCLVAAPKDLFSHARTPYDFLITARAVAVEVYNRGWGTIELSGFDKMVRAAWVKLQIMGTQQGRMIEILHYKPQAEDVIIYQQEMNALSSTKPAFDG